MLSKEPISLFLCNHSLTVHMHLAKAGAVSRCLCVAEQDTDKAAFPGLAFYSRYLLAVDQTGRVEIIR